MLEPSRNRLDGWKAIADYLGKDTSTAMRWARKRAMPVRRVPGGGNATVYAFTDELDAWLQRVSDNAHTPSVDASESSSFLGGADPPQLSEPKSRRISGLVLLGLGLTALIALTGVLMFAAHRHTGSVERVSFTGDKLLAYDTTGRLAWEHDFHRRIERSAFERVQKERFVDLDSDGRQELIVVAAFSDEGTREMFREDLYCFSAGGDVLWTYDPKMKLSFAGREYEGPWLITDLLVRNDGNTKSIWLALTHHTWWPSFVVKLDATGTPALQFVNSGGTYGLAYLRNDDGSFVLACGVNNEYSAGMLAVLNENLTPATSPQSPDSTYHCDHCPDGQPFRYFLFPRSELNLLLGAPYNPVKTMAVFENQIELQPDEVVPDARLIYDFSKNLDIKRIYMSDGYAELHQRLEKENKIGHSFQECPMLAKPVRVRVWDLRSGWMDIEVPWATAQTR